MKIYKDIDSIKIHNAVVTIGTFDGLHRGHLQVLEYCKSVAKSIKGESIVFTFSPHPRIALEKDTKNLKLLTTLDEKIFLFEKIGICNLIIFPFTKDFAKLRAFDFIKNILVEKLNIHTLVIGYDHHFGKDRNGNFSNLEKYSQEFNFKLQKISALSIDKINISSTKIREALTNGEIEKANDYLNYSYSLSGKVIKGKQIGRTLGFSTANISISDSFKLIPKSGVYAVKVYYEDQYYKAMLNIGMRPTLEEKDKKQSIEVHIFNFKKDIYGENLKIFLKFRLRDEKKFSDLKSLKMQLNKDKNQILKLNLL